MLKPTKEGNTIVLACKGVDLPARELAEWIIQDRLPVRFQMQLHKQLWGDAQGR